VVFLESRLLSSQSEQFKNLSKSSDLLEKSLSSGHVNTKQAASVILASS